MGLASVGNFKDITEKEVSAHHTMRIGPLLFCNIFPYHSFFLNDLSLYLYLFPPPSGYHTVNTYISPIIFSSSVRFCHKDFLLVTNSGNYSCEHKMI